MAPASLHNNHEAARGTLERWSTTSGTFSWPAVTPACLWAVPSCFRHSDHCMPKAGPVLAYGQILSLLDSSIPQQPTTPS
jgi:hypothetical protein